MKSKIAGLLPLLWLLAIPVLNLFYTFLNHRETTVRSLMTSLDERIPFVPAFIIPYVLWYPFIIIMLIVLFLKNRQIYYRTLLTLCLGLITCYIFYYFYQTTVGRPLIIENGFLHELVKLIYAMDRPYNCFPSIHVFTSYLMLKGMTDCANWSRIAHLLAIITSWTIIVSTLFVKQHVWLDIAGGILVAELLYAIVRKWIIVPDKRPRRATSQGEDQRPAARASRSSQQ